MLATSAAASTETTCLGRSPIQDSTMDAAKTQVGSFPGLRAAAPPFISYGADDPHYCACAAPSWAAPGMLRGAGTEDARNRGGRRATLKAEVGEKDAENLAGDSLAEMIGGWNSRFSSRLRVGRGPRDSSPTQRRGGLAGEQFRARGSGALAARAFPAARAVLTPGEF